jgi:hypothetical protein
VVGIVEVERHIAELEALEELRRAGRKLAEGMEHRRLAVPGHYSLEEVQAQALRTAVADILLGVGIDFAADMGSDLEEHNWERHCSLGAGLHILHKVVGRTF